MRGGGSQWNLRDRRGCGHGRHAGDPTQLTQRRHSRRGTGMWYWLGLPMFGAPPQGHSLVGAGLKPEHRFSPAQHQIGIAEFEHGPFLCDRLIAGDEHAAGGAPPQGCRQYDHYRPAESKLRKHRVMYAPIAGHEPGLDGIEMSGAAGFFQPCDAPVLIQLLL